MARSEAMSGTMTGSVDFSVSSSLGRSLTGTGGRILTNLSPLSDRDKLKPSDNLEAMANDLTSTGLYEVGWDSDNGRLQIASTPSSPVQLYQTNPASIDAFLNPQLHSSRKLLRPRTQSSLTFTKSKACSENSMSNRGGLAKSVDFGDLGLRSRPGTSGSGGRFSRLNQSVESINALNGGGAGGVAAANIAALNYGQQPRMMSPSFRPASRPATPSAAMGAVSPSGRPSSAPVQSHVQYHVWPQTPPGGDAARPGSPSARPGTPSVVDLNGGAATGFEASTSQGGREAVMTRGRSPLSTTIIGSLKAMRPHPMSTFRPNRSHAFLVFNDLDKEKNGKITRAQLEMASLSLGLTLEQVHKFFDKLDSSQKSYISVTDWGKPEMCKAIEQFALMYLHKYLGLPDITASDEQVKRYWRNQSMKQAKNLPAAINHVRVNAITRASHSSSGSGNVVYDAFRFMDTDNSGELSKSEVKDGFYALGVNITDEIADQIFTIFDKDGSGAVGYHEFIAGLFPQQRAM